jgi:type IV pilus assembly protein PilX
MVIGVAVARGALILLAAAHNERDRDVAQAAAEAALRDAEHDIAGGTATGVPVSPDRDVHFAPAGAAAFVDGCGRGADDLGLCRARSPPAWQTLDLAADGNPALVPYGRYTGAVLAAGSGSAPARLPAYLIERIAPPGATAQQGSFYRITAIGFGTRASTQVVLQTLYRRPRPGPAAGHAGGPGDGNGNGNGGGHDDGNDTGDGYDDGNEDTHSGGNGRPSEARPQGRQLPAGRIGWRDIANWAELHARAQP